MMFGQIIVFFLLFCGTSSGVNGDPVNQSNKIVHLFDKAIQQFVRQFALSESESTSSSNATGQEWISVSFTNAATILKEIEENVADKFIDKVVGEQEGILNFHGTLSAINEKIHHQFQKEMSQTSKKELEVKLLSFDIAEEEQKRLEPNGNAQLFYLLLTFAIRMGFHIGHKNLNSERATEHSKINLHKFVHAQNCLEDLYFKADSDKSWTHILVFESVPTSKLIRLNFSPVAPWVMWQIQYNLGTIKLLLLNPLGITIEGWRNLVERILGWDLNDRYVVDNPTDPQNPFDRLAVGWNGITRKNEWYNYRVDLLDFCAFKNFGINMAKRLTGWEKYSNKSGRITLAELLNGMNGQYEMHCGKKLKEAMAKNHMEYEILALKETFMHYEDAIVLTIKEYEEIAKQWIESKVLKWQKEFTKCEIKDSILAKCNLGEILTAIKSYKASSESDYLGLEIQDFLRITEFKVEARWTNLAEKVEQLVESMKKTKEKIDYLRTSKRIKSKDRILMSLNLLSQEKRGVMLEIQIEEATMKREFDVTKGAVLKQFELLIEEVKAINWAKLLEEEKQY